LRGAALWDAVKDKLQKSGLSLSGGQQQRLCIARAIATEPEVLLMDEPCSALDPIATRKIEDLMRDLRQRFTIAIVTHNLQQAQRVALAWSAPLSDRETHSRQRRAQPLQFARAWQRAHAAPHDIEFLIVATGKAAESCRCRRNGWRRCTHAFTFAGASFMTIVLRHHALPPLDATLVGAHDGRSTARTIHRDGGGPLIRPRSWGAWFEQRDGRNRGERRGR
jgi:hypothetical protein